MVKCQIRTTSKKHFNTVFNKLAAFGFVYSARRLRTVKEIDENWEYFKYIKMGGDAPEGCKMVLHGDIYPRCGYKTMTVNKFITEIFPTWFD